jgi:hypothetical protein
MELVMLKYRKNGLSASLILALLLLDSACLAAETTTHPYPPVFDRPPASEKPALSKDEQSKVKNDLAKARDRQNSQMKARDATPAPKSKTPK